MMRRGIGRGPARGAMMRRHRRMRRRMRRRILIGGMVVVGAGTAAYKMSQPEVEQVEQHTGKQAEDLSEDEMNQAMDDLGIEGQEVTDLDMAQLEAADDAANAAAAAPAAVAATAAAPVAPAQGDYSMELQELADLHAKGILRLCAEPLLLQRRCAAQATIPWNSRSWQTCTPRGFSTDDEFSAKKKLAGHINQRRHGCWAYKPAPPWTRSAGSIDFALRVFRSVNPRGRSCRKDQEWLKSTTSATGPSASDRSSLRRPSTTPTRDWMSSTTAAG